MAIDIFEPEVSQVIKGVQGKLFFIYGTNSTGKTKNCAQAEKPLFAAFEKGLNAIPGKKFLSINKWNDWTRFVKQLTDPSTKDQAKELYSTIIVDTAEGMANLASDFVCGAYGVNRIADGNKGYGLWREYSAEIEKWLKLLTNAGYTVIFIGHEGEREFLDETGEKYSKLYPRGDKRVIDPICDLVDVIGYAQIQPNVDGKEVKSTLYLKGTPAYHARSRFEYIVPEIKEWTFEKLSKALVDAITAEEKASGVKAVSLDSAQKAATAKAEKEEAAKRPIEDMIEEIGNRLKTAVSKYGKGVLQTYSQLLADKLGNADFKAIEATDANRQQLDLILEGLTELGY